MEEVVTDSKRGVRCRVFVLHMCAGVMETWCHVMRLLALNEIMSAVDDNLTTVRKNQYFSLKLTLKIHHNTSLITMLILMLVFCKLCRLCEIRVPAIAYWAL